MEIKSIVITETKAEAVYKSVKNAFPNIEVVMLDKDAKHLPQTDAYIGFGPVLDFTSHKYKWVHCLGAGVDRFINDGLLDERTILTRTIDQFGYQIASFCLGYMLSVEHKTFDYLNLQKASKWQRIGKGTIKNKKVVIFGTGEIGKDIARILKQMETTTVGVSKSGRKVDYFDKVYPMDKTHLALLGADWVINILPLTAQTVDLFDARMFSQMNQANFINVGRGKTVNEEDLLTAIKNNHINYAILDVQANEPLPPISPLYQEEKVIITPHISGIPDMNQSAITIIEIIKKLMNEEELDCKVDLTKQY